MIKSRRRPSFFVLPLLILATTAGGCGGDDQVKNRGAALRPSSPPAASNASVSDGASAQASVSPRRRSTVSLARVAAHHPLQRDVMRLANAERRLRGILNAPRLVTAERRVVLPPLSPSTDLRESALSASFVRAVQRVRARLEQDALRRVARLARGLRERNERAVARRRAELLSGLDVKLADASARAEKSISVETNEKLSQLAPVLANLTLQRDALTTNINLLAVVRDAAAVESEIAQLRKNPATPFLSERAHFEFGLRNNAARRAEVEATIAALRAAGLEQVRLAVADARARFLADAEAQVLQYAQTLAASRGARGRASEALTLLAGAARDVARENSLTLPGVASYQRRIAVAGAIDANNVRAAADRIGRQRARLVRFIRADTRAAILDAASARNVSIAFSASETEDTQPRTGAELSDAEREAARWIFPAR